MLNQMQENGIRAIAVKNMSVMMTRVMFSIENMAEQFFAEFLQKIILGFKVRVKGGSSHIRPVDNFSHRNLAEIFFGKQLRKGVKNSLPGFSLASIHMHSPYNFCYLFSNE